MKTHYIRTGFPLRADDVAEAAKKAFQIMAEYPHLPVVVSTFLTGTQRERKSVFTRDGTLYGTRFPPMGTGFREADKGDALFSIAAQFQVQEESYEAAAKKAFETLSEDNLLTIRISEVLPGGSSKLCGTYTRDAVAEVVPHP